MSEDRPAGTPSRSDGTRAADEERAIVEYLGRCQLDKFSDNRHRAHWAHVTCRYLLGRLRQEVGELEAEMEKGYATRPADYVVSECADVANFAAMIADNWRFGREGYRK